MEEMGITWYFVTPFGALRLLTSYPGAATLR